jgi:hypothetical protein
MKRSRWLKRGTKLRLWIATISEVARVKLRASRFQSIISKPSEESDKLHLMS